MPGTQTPTRRPVGRPGGATRQQVFDAACRHFLAGRRLDIAALAAETGISRPTVHRWFGTREALYGLVIAELFDATVREAHRRRPRADPVELVVYVAEFVAGSVPLRRFLEQEGDAALRTLTKSDGHVQPRSVELMLDILEGSDPPAEPKVLAYAVVRLFEAFIYNDGVAGLRRDTAGLRAVLRALLRP